jgi:hypothetical protein
MPLKSIKPWQQVEGKEGGYDEWIFYTTNEGNKKISPINRVTQI